MEFWGNAIRNGQREYGQLGKFEADPEELDLEEFKFERFRIIGTLIEASIQPFLKEFICILQQRYEQTQLEEVDKMYLGAIMSQIEREIGPHNLITPQPWNIKLNQWRNIAQHHSAKVKDGRIICSFAKGKSISLTREDLQVLAIEVMRRLSILKGARELFILNSIEDLQDFSRATEPPDFETKILELASAFATQGFRTVNVDEKEKTIMYELEDLRPQQGDSRLFHSAQFVVPIGTRFPQKDVNIIYRNKYGICFTVSAPGKALSKFIKSGENLVEIHKFLKIEKVV